MNGVTRSSLALRSIAAMLFTKHMRAGAKLPSAAEIAKSTQTGVVTVREALAAMRSLGLVEITHGRGIFVTEGSQSIVHGLFEARELIECYHVRHAATRCSAGDVSALRELVDRMEKACDEGDGVGYTELDLEFHLALGGTTGNRTLLQTLTNIRTILHLHIAAANRSVDSMRRSCAGHRELVEAIARREPEVASRTMSRHLLDVRQKYEAVMKGGRSQG
jgi:GntR family transcriptional regulator, transcriptional repressor for pyruvate dehydrogenase complex